MHGASYHTGSQTLTGFCAMCVCRLVLQTPDGLASDNGPAELPVGRLQLMEVVDMLLDICRGRQQAYGMGHPTVGDAHLVTALALVQLEEKERAQEQLDAARAVLGEGDLNKSRLMDMTRIMCNAISGYGA